MSSSDVDICTVDATEEVELEETKEIKREELDSDIDMTTFSPVTAKVTDADVIFPSEVEMTRTYSCLLCDFSCDARDDMEEHQKTHSGAKSFHCKFCSYKTTQEGNLHRHVQTHLRMKLFKCSYCDFASPHRPVLVNHERVHTGEKPYKCDQCPYSCRQQGHLVSHKRVHSGDRPYKCKHCNYATSQSNHLKTHMKRHMGIRPYQCSYCNYSCRERGTLIIHQRIHTGEKPFNCSLCGYRTGRKSHLQEHLKTHTGEKPYKCEICDFSTAQHPHMIMHTRKHTREKPFQCEECPYRAMCPSALKVHRRMHTCNEAFKCRFCTFSSSRQVFVKNHIAQVHALTEALECDRCPFKTYEMSDYKAHVELHENHKSYDCTLCKYSTPFQILYNRHKGEHLKKASEYFNKSCMRYCCKMCPFSCTDAIGIETHLKTHSDSTNTGVPSPSVGALQKSKYQTKPESTLIYPSHESGPFIVNGSTPDSPTEATVGTLPDVPISADCSVIPVTYESITDLTNEEVEVVMKQEGARPNKPYVCQYCDRGFDDNNEWQKHVQRHFMKWPTKK